MNIGDVLGSVVSGVATGGYGAIFGGIFAFGKQWLENRQQMALMELQQKEREKERQHDIALIDKEIDKAVIKTEAEKDIADIQALAEANKSQDKEIEALKPALERAHPLVASIAAIFLSTVTVISKTIRPGLTIAMMVIATNLLFKTGAMVGNLDAFQRVELIEIYKRLIYMVIELASLSFTFWFLARPNSYRK